MKVRVHDPDAHRVFTLLFGLNPAILSQRTMIELYQFEISSYAEKVRFVLDYKGLDYKKVEVLPAIGQVEIGRAHV